MARWIGLPAAIATILTVVPTRVFAQQVAETEPNNSRAAASLAHLGDTVSGTMPYLDVDYFAIDLSAGTKLVVTLLNHQFCPEFNLWDSNGKPSIIGAVRATLIRTIRFPSRFPRPAATTSPSIIWTKRPATRITLRAHIS